MELRINHDAISATPFLRDFLSYLHSLRLRFFTFTKFETETCEEPFSKNQFDYRIEMVEKYERAKDSLYPQVYHTFMAKGRESDELVEYCVQDLTDDHAKKAVEMILTFLTPEETFQRAVKMAENDLAKGILESFYIKTIKERVSLGCFELKTNEMVGLNAMTIKSRNHEEVYEVCI